MLLATSALKGYAIEASDGRVGTISDLLFDDQTWKIRWIVVDTGTWLTARRVLLHPSAVAQANHDRRELLVKLNKEQVEKSPKIQKDQPVSRQVEDQLYAHYEWDPTWGSSYFTIGEMASPTPSPRYFHVGARSEAVNETPTMENGDPHLRSIAAVTGYHILATDGAIGHVENFFMDDASWDIRYFLFDTRNWWPGKHVLVSPYAVQEIIWSDHQIRVNVTRDQVKASPPWDPKGMIDKVYEKKLHSHYGWRGYGF